ncbi:MAG: small, acid-soluble spore protein, alpha/beta type [Tissierellaceae bacterium]
MKKKKNRLEDKLKYEIAEELGLMGKIEKEGWGALTAKESGRIGGLITVRKREMKKKKI